MWILCIIYVLVIQYLYIIYILCITNDPVSSHFLATDIASFCTTCQSDWLPHILFAYYGMLLLVLVYVNYPTVLHDICVHHIQHFKTPSNDQTMPYVIFLCSCVLADSHILYSQPTAALLFLQMTALQGYYILKNTSLNGLMSMKLVMCYGLNLIKHSTAHNTVLSAKIIKTLCFIPIVKFQRLLSLSIQRHTEAGGSTSY